MASLGMGDTISLFFAQKLGCLSPCVCWSKHRKLLKMLEKGNDKVEDSMDMAKHIMKSRNSTILLEHSLLSKQIKMQMKTNKRNVIDLEEGNDQPYIMANLDRSAALRKSVYMNFNNTSEMVD